MMPKGIPSGLAVTTNEIFNPTKDVIVDMIMVQLLTITLSLLAILMFKGGDINGNDMAWLVGGVIFFFLVSICHLFSYHFGINAPHLFNGHLLLLRLTLTRI